MPLGRRFALEGRSDITRTAAEPRRPHPSREPAGRCAVDSGSYREPTASTSQIPTKSRRLPAKEQKRSCCYIVGNAIRKREQATSKKLSHIRLRLAGNSAHDRLVSAIRQNWRRRRASNASAANSPDRRPRPLSNIAQRVAAVQRQPKWQARGIGQRGISKRLEKLIAAIFLVGKVPVYPRQRDIAVMLG